MLKNEIKKLISDMVDKQKLELFSEEKEYAERHHFLTSEMKEKLTVIEKNPTLRFMDAYIERSDKETEEVIGVEKSSFLQQPLDHLKKQMNEFIYLESNWFEMINVDAVSLEVDDVFRTYDVMLGLKFQKKFEGTIKSYLENHLSGDEAKFDLMFNHDDGLWNLNFDLNSIDGFNDGMTIGEAYQLIYQFLFNLVETVEESK